MLTHRPRRLRSTAAIRGLVRETRVHPEQLVLPAFVQEGESGSTPIDAMPGVHRHTIDSLLALIDEAMRLGVHSFAHFPKVADRLKTPNAREALRPETLACRAFRACRERFPEATLIADIALDPYSPDGHDGLVRDGVVVNDDTVAMLADMAVVHAEAGANILAPSDMMDGRVAAIRAALDSKGLTDTLIMSYAVKYASAFYGPFRGALDSAPKPRGGVPSDKKTYQMDPANTDEALREAALDVEEGADIVMVKPGLPYLDVIHRVSRAIGAPVAAYQVSGEYAMLRAAADAGGIAYTDALRETIVALARGGARIILTYGALDYARAWHDDNRSTNQGSTHT
ncbi:MAG: porphobilinogen synthase [Planctomycetota bacterium]